jgi:uroporphyrinogen-III synthase
VAEVYRREQAKHTPEDLRVLEARFAAGALDVVTATSVEMAASLLALATPAMRRDFDRVQWLVPSARVAAAVRERGVTAPMLVADSAEDQDLVAAIKRWRSSVSGA